MVKLLAMKQETVIPKIVIIGRPNVGKSSLFNRIIKKRQAIVHDVAGTTRDVISETVEVDDKVLELFDTAGYLREKGETLSELALQKVKEAVAFADQLVFVVDGMVPPTNIDIVIADIARKSGKEVILVINKIDNPGKPNSTEEYLRMGFKTYFQVSVIHNIGTTDLVQKISSFAVPGKKKEEEKQAAEIKISIIGRPNVGKSSLLNALAKKERAIVSDIAGTTRDVITEKIEDKEVTFSLSDTAGARKPGKIGKAFKKGEPVEKYSYLRTEREVENSDIVLVVLDASERIAAQDLHIAGKARELGKGIVLVINKWDLVENLTQEKYLARLRREFNFMIWVPAIFVSAKTGKNIENVWEVVKTVSDNQRRQVPTSKLNRIVEDFVLNTPPLGMKNVKPKVFFVAQTDIIPPTFTLTARHHLFIHFSWRRALENELRRNFDFTGTPIKIVLKEKGK